MSSRILVLGIAPSPVTSEVCRDIAAQLTTKNNEQSLVEMDALAGVPLRHVLASPQATLPGIAAALRTVDAETLLIEGLTATPVASFDVLGWNLQVGANIGAQIIAAIDGNGLSETLLRQEILTLASRAQHNHATLAGVVVAGARGVNLAGLPVATANAPLRVEDLEVFLTARPTVTTPLMFQGDLLATAAANPQRIVLPEPEDDRILRASADLLAQRVAEIILIGEQEQVDRQASELGIDLSAARVVSPHTPDLVEKYATEFAKIRAKKGVTLPQATTIVQDPTYFATMMVHMGDADGMVSGAVHTTASTIVPAFQIIKTAPGVSLVSSTFLMLMADRVLVMGDCAVNPNPTPEQLAEIAMSSAHTASQFGLTPKVAMLSYSTGNSGAGPDIDAVRAATTRVKELDPTLLVDGPIQYDAAVDPTTGAAKAPGSPVAGEATVLIFPSLNAGNIGYKAIQRSSGAIAIGPILQGLRRPVNDLSRGALVEDIVNTVAITAVQAQAEGNR